MTKEEKRKCYCGGCYKNVYNNGTGGSKECWSLKTSKVMLRKRVSINQQTPWKQKPTKMLSCLTGGGSSGYVYVTGDAQC